MAKKKKKAAKGPQGNITPASTASVSKSRGREASTVPDDNAISFLALKLRVSAKKEPKPSLKFDSDPVLSVEAEDAQRVQLKPKDHAIVFCKHKDSNAIAGAFVCKVAISTRNSSNNRQLSATSGSCTLEPSFVLDSFLEGSKDNLNTAQREVTSTPPATATPKQSTPSSGFSFAKGGGGDALISSPSSYATPTKVNQNATRVLSVWVVPMTSSLGKDAASVLCRDAKQVHVEIPDESFPASRLATTSQLLKQLVLAQLKDRFIHASCVAPVSFAGKPLNLHVKDITGAESPAKSDDLLLELEMESLEIQDEYPEEDHADFEAQIWTRIREGLENPKQAQSLLLYKIRRSTTITIISSSSNQRTESTADTMPAEERSESSPLRVVAGLSETAEKVKKLLLRPILEPELFSQRAMKAPRGVLLHGSHGVGKSCLARQIAVDLEREHPGKLVIESVNCASLQSYTGQVGEAERRIVRIFEKVSMSLTEEGGAKGKIGALLVFDDIHFVCPKRSGYNVGADRLTATLLGLLDGIGSASSKHQTALGGAISSGIVILGITTDPSKLDPALRRPGRLDFEVEVPGPDNAEARSEIIKFQLEDIGADYNLPSFTDEQFLELGSLAKGFNGADCMLAVKEGIRIAMIRGQTSQDLDEQLQAGGKPACIETLRLTDLKAAVRATKPTAIKSITLEIPKVPWTSIGGMDCVKEQLREALEMPETHQEFFDRLRIPAPRGILLFGPPGCSKTLMARALATEGKMNFLAVKGPELLSKWLGESERALASLFRRARSAAPSIVFFDEIDAIAAERGSDINSGGGRLLSQLLTELDGIHTTGGITVGNKKHARVVVVAATNRPDLIDRALMRPGRIDRKIYVGPPDEQSRRKIFEIGLQDRNCADDIDISYLARDEVSGGYSGAELIAVCKDGAWLALEEDDQNPVCNELPSLRMRHLLKAINSMKPQITNEMTSFYESFRQQNKR
ncbi:Spermatogenesis-associated protein 5-like protein 1 [Seminavis robusta]|uniref:Spermatogenesis-associated protein 5-like protein 1 n=1 Tax=Seminavis robusta TaxID=568900 RepID=A0A9N8DHL9_9STRA|nr:Spermatogenesis-associated protein 5-like protein 1 [Seminavis robusta]|eukprot:Sro157_g071160.1 Spermatogenesis-associated protein 5-like protein 1 (973) ;mRNA; r:41950-45135